MALEIMSAPNPHNGKFELHTVDNEPLPGLPKEINPGADIGEEVAIQKALLTLATYRATNPTVIRLKCQGLFKEGDGAEGYKHLIFFFKKLTLF